SRGPVTEPPPLNSPQGGTPLLRPQQGLPRLREFICESAPKDVKGGVFSPPFHRRSGSRRVGGRPEQAQLVRPRKHLLSGRPGEGSQGLSSPAPVAAATHDPD